jgi:ketosteroid isomerase-like protein
LAQYLRCRAHVAEARATITGHTAVVPEQRHVEHIRIGLEAWNRRNLDRALSGLHPEIEWRIPEAERAGLDFDEVYHGPEGVRKFWQLFWDAWEEISLEPEEFVELGVDRVLVLGRFRGRGRGSGAEVEQTFGHIYEFRDDLIAGFEAHWTREAALEALGLPG